MAAGSSPPARADHGADAFGAVLSSEIAASFQPIGHLAIGQPVAFEALARGPRASGLETPDALQMQVFVEVTERALTLNPARLLESVELTRRRAGDRVG